MRLHNRTLTMLILFALCQLALAGCIPVCGDSECEGNETMSSCPQDCDPCGNGHCGLLETNSNCPADCPRDVPPPVCDRDGDCESGETITNCPADCIPRPPCDEDGFCDWNESFETCPWDCQPDPGPECGNGRCEEGENASNCYADCGRCGDRLCTGPETVFTCDADCSGWCGDGFCEFGEGYWNCVADCGCGGDFPVDCGDGTGCWSVGTNCYSSVFSCGGVNKRCVNPSDRANCCNGQFATCPAAYPFWCPESNRCYTGTSYPSFCSQACTTHGWPCS